jgi:hypothetical protein
MFPYEPKVSEETINLMKMLIEKDENVRITFKHLSEQILGDETDKKDENTSVLYS